MSAGEHSASTSALRGVRDAAEATWSDFSTSRSPVDSGTGFDPHLHQEDQLAWMSSGSMEVTVQGSQWQLRREHFVWIPAGTLHAMNFDEPGELLGIYSDPALRPRGAQWESACTVGAADLAVSLLLHLTDAAPPLPRRARCHGLLTELLEDARVENDVIALPRDARARVVAESLLARPADAMELEDWARELGVSSKTIARAFLADTGSTFREWRIRARLHAAAGMLAEGVPVHGVAGEVGYRSVSSFIASFKLRFGVTPARYAGALADAATASTSST